MEPWYDYGMATHARPIPEDGFPGNPSLLHHFTLHDKLKSEEQCESGFWGREDPLTGAIGGASGDKVVGGVGGRIGGGNPAGRMRCNLEFDLAGQ